MSIIIYFHLQLWHLWMCVNHIRTSGQNEKLKAKIIFGILYILTYLTFKSQTSLSLKRFLCNLNRRMISIYYAHIYYSLPLRHRITMTASWDREFLVEPRWLTASRSSLTASERPNSANIFNFLLLTIFQI